MTFHIPASNDWPPLYRLFIYDEELCVVCESSDRKFDLNDNLFQTWGSDTRTVYLGIETRSTKWLTWEEAALTWIERHIAFDLEFDGNEVEVSRHAGQVGGACTEEYIWKVVMRDE